MAQQQGAALFFIALLIGQHAIEAYHQIDLNDQDGSDVHDDSGVSSAAVSSPMNGQTSRYAFAVPSESVSKLAGLADSGGERSRRLAVITVDLPQDSTSLTIVPQDSKTPAETCRPNGLPPCSELNDVFAGRTLSTVEISVAPDVFDVAGGKFRVVTKDVTKAMAQQGACKEGDIVNSAHSGTVSDPWGADGSGTTKMGQNIMRGTSTLTFLMGGHFRLCYSNDGSFEENHVDIVPTLMNVKGFYDSSIYCNGGDSCMTTRQHRCYVLKQAYNNMQNTYAANSNCIVDFDKSDAGFVGNVGKGSWSQPYAVAYDADHKVTTITPRACGGVPAYFLCSGGGSCDATPSFFSPDATRSNKRLPVPAARNDLTTSFKAYMIAACYCPDFDLCDAAEDYVQQVGILYYYATRVCPHGYDAVACNPDFAGVAPQNRFAMRVECPGDACTANGNSMMKIVAQNANNDLPAWDTNNGCSGGVHGQSIKGNYVMPSETNVDVTNVYGGNRQDWKLWNFPNGGTTHETAGFLFKKGYADHELRNFHEAETFDICYCDNACTTPRNWFKTGQLRFASFQLVSAAMSTSQTAGRFAVSYVHQAGVIGFYRPPTDYNVMGLQEGGMLKLVEDNAMQMNDAKCVSAIYDRYLVSQDSGPYPGQAHTDYAGKTTVNNDTQKLMFNGGILGRQITVKKAGALAVCYCARVDTLSGVCVRDQWVMAVRFTVRGPAPGQSWQFSTHVVFRFTYTGWGLTNDDKVRIIPATASCTDNNQDPSGAYIVTNMKMNCPDPCSEIGSTSSVVNGDLSQIVVGDSTFMCDSKNKNCRNNDIKTVEQVDATKTKLTFEADTGLQDGDLLSLNENIECDPTDTTCLPEHIAVLKGRYNYADYNTNHVNAPNEYIAGHAITRTSKPKELTIPVGWPGTPPRFQVLYANNKRGRWNQHNRAVTVEEAMGTKERQDMKVCWKYGGALGTFVTEVGRLTLMDPNPMTDCLISLTSTVKGQRAPMVISFKTAAAQTGKRYSSVQGSTRLKLIFMRTLAVEMRFVDDSKIENNAGEDEMSEAKQYICGKLFKELWSSDKDLGFPMPRGCYHQSYGIKREFTMLFERKNGLRAGMDYQIVVNGIATEESQGGTEYIQIFTMDDTETKPYEAIERGNAVLGETPQDAAYGGQGVKWLLPDGFKIVRGTGANLYKVGNGSPIYAEMRGDIAGGGIAKNAILRIFLSPLTQWSVETECSAGCIPFDQVTAPCGEVQSCMAEPTVPNFAKNVLILQLPSDMATCTTEVYQTIFVSNLKLPAGGFFATKLGAQISRPDDTKPHYTVSVGDFLYKEPEEGETIGRLVENYGDGDQKPFRGDKNNVLYVHLVLAATLFSAVQNGDASLKLTLPPGYECVRPVDIDGRSPWEVEETLGVFDSIPQGRGTADDGSGTRGWSTQKNNCTYTLRQNGVVYAGSSLFFRVTLNNPLEALSRKNTSNRWTTSLSSKGVHQWAVTFPSETFKTKPGKYGDNAAVLGRIEMATLVPMNFGKSSSAIVQEEGLMQVFFMTEQTNGVGGFVRLVAPNGFVFTPTPCQASDLSSYHYHVRKKAWDTRRLPGITSCSYYSTPFNRAEIGLSGALQPKTFYAFKINVRNAIPYLESQMDGWKLFTLTREKYGVDGTPKPVKLAVTPLTTNLGASVTNRSFGMHQQPLNTANIERVKISISNLRPYSMSQSRSIVTVRPLKVPVSKASTLRIIAPDGFIWDFSSAEFLHSSTGAGSIPCITATLPGGVPSKDGNLLLWSSPAMYSASHTYGFSAPIRVPDQTPSWSSNGFIVEFGYDSMTLDGRIGASMVEVITDRTQNNVQFNDQNEGGTGWLFQVYVSSAIPSSGNIQLLGPAGFYLNGNCTSALKVAPVLLGCAGKKLPPQTQCGYSVAGVTTIITLTHAGTIPAGFYRFELDFTAAYDKTATNPVKVESACGYHLCWRYQVNGAGAAYTDYLDWRVNNQLGGRVVSAIADVAIDYRTNVESKPNDLIFQVQTITPIYKDGGILWVGPPGFDIPNPCTILAAPAERGSPYELEGNKGRVKQLPSNVKCESTAAFGINVTVKITAQDNTPIEPGLYRWKLAVVNPKMITPNPEDFRTACGYRHCWSVTTVERFGATPEVLLDVPMVTKSFEMNRKMVEALLPVLTPSQRTASLRDDRPLSKNPLVFAFKLNKAIIAVTEMMIRAPLGYIFSEECLSDIEWRGFMVFGSPLDTVVYTEWDAGVKILSCRGEGPDARLMLDPGSSRGLQAEALYPFRIAVASNPVLTPEHNYWSIEYAGESCSPFIGFPLWTFSRLAMSTVSAAVSNPITGMYRFRNPVTIVFRPHNDVMGAGKKIYLTAPPNFEIARDYLNKCKLRMQPLTSDPAASPDETPTTNFTAPLSHQWLQADCDCVVDENNPRRMEIQVLAFDRELYSHTDYQLTVFVENPTVVPIVADYRWLLETVAAPNDYKPLFRDLSVLTGYGINERVDTFVVRNEDPRTKISFRNGKTPVPGMYMELRFTFKIETNDVIDIVAPSGFSLASDPAPEGDDAFAMGASCNNWRWEPVDQPYLTKSSLLCIGGRLQIRYMEDRPYPELAPIKWRIDTFNVAKTPHIMLNHWTATVRTQTGAVRASESVLSWDIRPQLEDIEILVTGAEMAAGSKSKMSISFIPIQGADELELTAKLPAGFDFTGTGSEIIGHEVISTSVEKIRVRVPVFTGVRALIKLTDFKLGLIGGPTVFDLVTKLNDGTYLDERMGFTGGFRLPGRLTVVDKKLNSFYQQDAVKYPVPSLFGIRTKEAAQGRFVFHLTRQANIGTRLRIEAAPYSFVADDFKLEEVSTLQLVATEINAPTGAYIDVTLLGPLWANTPFRVQVNCITTPTVMPPDKAMWSFTILDNDPLPVNTNDKLTPGFLQVKQMPFLILAGKSPPMARIPVEVQIDPMGTKMNELIVVAPPLFNFTENCLVEKGEGDVALSCERTAPVAGREAALIRYIEGGLTQVTELVKITVITPATNAPDPTWYAQARHYQTNTEVGWGQDYTGLQVRQMRGAGVVFPGIPSISGQMAFRFETNLKIEGNGKLRIGYPKSIIVNCKGAFLHRVGLQGDIRCLNFPREGYFEIFLPRPLPPGRQALAVTSTCPNAINDEGGNNFYIMVFEPEEFGGNVNDAAMSIPGMRIQHGFSVKYLPLIWGSSEADRPAFVSLGFELLADLPERDPPTISEILIRLPMDFYHVVRRLSQVEVMSEGGGKLPLRTGLWLDFKTSPLYLRLFLDEIASAKLQPGRYRIQFPVWVPGRMARNNVWMLTLCGPASMDAGKACMSEHSPRSLVTFPLAGFAMNEVHPSVAQDGQIAGACSRTASLLMVVLSVLAFFRD